MTPRYRYMPDAPPAGVPVWAWFWPLSRDVLATWDGRAWYGDDGCALYDILCWRAA